MKDVLVRRNSRVACTPGHFTYRVVAKAGVLMYGSSDDFLCCVAIAREKKAELLQHFPGSVLRIHILYPNGERVPSADLAACVNALDSVAPQTEYGCPVRPSIGQLVALRRAAAVRISPARSGARTAEMRTAAGGLFAVDVAVDFSQAGVVAPPDGLTGGTSVVGSIGDSA